MEMNRRKFLGTSAGAVATSTLVSKRSQAGPNEVLNVAVLGLNGRGASHYQAFAGAKETRVSVLCDVDQTTFQNAVSQVESIQGSAPKVETDLRRIMDDPSIDIVSIATPDHWHALAAIWGCQAKKDVYVEKPVSHNVWEGRKIVEAARKHGRVVQTGTQNRSIDGVREAIQFLHDGKLGHVYMAKGLCFKRRRSIGFKNTESAPSTLNWDLLVGPAPMQDFHQNLVHYNWHWFWDFGTTDMGNQGVHQMDIARWGLNKNTLPTSVHGVGGRWGYKDQAETPNTQHTNFQFDDSVLQFEVRGLHTHDETGVKVGNLFYGSEGWMVINGSNWEARSPDGDLIAQGDGGSGSDHFRNFIDAVVARKPEMLNADILEGHLSSALCHLGNISYRVNRTLTVNPDSETIVGDDQANQLVRRLYRAPFTVPNQV